MATMGVNASIDPVFDKSAPVLVGKLLADAMEGKARHRCMALCKAFLRLIIVQCCSLFVLATRNVVVEGSEFKPVVIGLVGANASDV